MILTERDSKLFNMLFDYGLLTTGQINHLIFNSIRKTTVLRRLRVLEERCLIKRINGLESFEALWFLTSDGAKTIGFDLSKSNWNKGLIDHDHQLISLRLKLEASLPIQKWIPEHELRSLTYKKYGLKDAQNKIIPDGIMILQGHLKNHVVSVELELTQKNKTKLRHTLIHYQDKKELEAIWYIAPTRSILISLFREWHDLPSSFKKAKLYGSLIKDVMTNPLEASLWDGDKTQSLNTIFQLRHAHSLAHPLSTQSSKGVIKKDDLSSPNYSESLICTS